MNRQTIVRRIVQAYEAASHTDREAGAQWYLNAHLIAQNYSRLTGHDIETCAAVIAHLSPRVHWRKNVNMALEVLQTKKCPIALQACVKRAVSAIESDNPISTLKGKKTRRFALNILGDEDSVAIDVWAIQVALGYRDEKLIQRVGVYEEIEKCYQIAAKKLGVSPSTVQATTWIAIRGKAT